MLVTVYKTVDIETEVSVDIDELVQEINSRVDEAEPQHHRRLVEGIASMLGIFLKIDQRVIPPATRQLIFEKLTEAAKRFEVKR